MELTMVRSETCAEGTSTSAATVRVGNDWKPQELEVYAEALARVLWPEDGGDDDDGDEGLSPISPRHSDRWRN